MKKSYLYLYRWLSITNHKNIGILYLLFGFIAGIIGTLFNIIIRVKFKGMLKLRKNWELYIIVLNLIMVLFLMLFVLNIKFIYLNIFNFWLLLLVLCIWMYFTISKSNKEKK